MDGDWVLSTILLLMCEQDCPGLTCSAACLACRLALASASMDWACASLALFGATTCRQRLHCNGSAHME